MTWCTRGGGVLLILALVILGIITGVIVFLWGVFILAGFAWFMWVTGMTVIFCIRSHYQSKIYKETYVCRGSCLPAANEKWFRTQRLTDGWIIASLAFSAFCLEQFTQDTKHFLFIYIVGIAVIIFVRGIIKFKICRVFWRASDIDDYNNLTDSEVETMESQLNRLEVGTKITIIVFMVILIIHFLVK